MNVPSRDIRSLENTPLRCCGHTEWMKEERLPKSVLHLLLLEGGDLYTRGKYTLRFLCKIKIWKMETRRTKYCRNCRRRTYGEINAKKQKDDNFFITP
jgi:hypothetical protein